MPAPTSTPETPIHLASKAPAAGATNIENVCKDAAAEETLPMIVLGVSDCSTYPYGTPSAEARIPSRKAPAIHKVFGSSKTPYTHIQIRRMRMPLMTEADAISWMGLFFQPVNRPRRRAPTTLPKPTELTSKPNSSPAKPRSCATKTNKPS